MCNPTVRGNDLASAVGTHLCMWGEELGTFGLLVMFYHYSVLLLGVYKAAFTEIIQRHDIPNFRMSSCYRGNYRTSSDLTQHE